MQVLSKSSVLRVSTINFVSKLISFTILFYVEGQLFPSLHLTAGVVAAIAIALTIVGTIADLLIVPPLGNLPALTLGFFGMTAIVWSIGFFSTAAHISLTNAMFMVLPIAVIEFALHRYVLDSLVR